MVNVTPWNSNWSGPLEPETLWSQSFTGKWRFSWRISRPHGIGQRSVAEAWQRKPATTQGGRLPPWTTHIHINPPPPILLHIFAYIHFGIRMLGSWRSRCHNFYGQTPLRSQHTYVIFLKLTHVFWQACDTIWSFSVQHIHSWALMTTYGIIIQLDHVDLYPPTLT